jgi:hypothetical protein
VRRWPALVAIFALAGCSAPAHTDGDLTNGWALPPAPAQFRPEAGKCFDDATDTVAKEDYAPLDCAERHLSESYYVGELTGAAAEADAADPVEGSPAQLAAGLQCAGRASAYAGGDIRAAQLTIRPVLPTEKAWAGGARWFRCDMIQIVVGGDSAVSREGTLKGLLPTPAGARLKLACFNPVVSAVRVESMKPVPCAGRHHAEYVGRWAPAHPTQALLNDDAAAARGCRSVIAGYAGVPDDGNLKYRTGWIGFSPTSQDWNAGIRDVRCFLWLDDITITGSYRHAGPGKLKINYA